MKRITTIVFSISAVVALSPFALSQDENAGKGGEKGKGKPPGERPERPEGERPPGGGLMMLPIHAALDIDKNGEISADELGQAAASLAKLDKNKDGKLTEEELRPPFMAGRPGMPEGGRPEGGSMADRLREMDKNSNGKLEAEELPEDRRERMLEFLDKNGDNVIDKAELEAMAQRFRDGKGGGEKGKGKGEGAGKGRSPEGGGGEGVKPKRPPLEE